MRKILAFVALLMLTSGAVSAFVPHPAEKLNRSDVIAGLGSSIPHSGSVEVFQLPNNGSSTPAGIAWDPSGKIWIAEAQADSLGLYDPAASKFEHFPLWSSGGQPYAVVPDPNGNIWFTEYMGDKIGVKFANGSFAEYPVAQKGSTPYEIRYNNGKVWFNEVNGNAIGFVDTATGKMEEFVLSQPGYTPVGLAVEDSGSTVWTVGFNGDGALAFNTTTKEFKEYSLGLNVCWGVMALPNSTVLISSLFDDAVTWFNPVTQKTIKYKFPQYTYPTRMAVGKNNTTWVINYMGDTLFKLDLKTGQYTPYQPPNVGRLWFPVDERSGMLWIADPMKNGLWSFNVSNSNFKFVLSDGQGKNSAPIGVARSGGTVWVAESGSGRVTSFDIASQTFKSYPTSNPSSMPGDVLVDAGGTVWVTLSGTSSLGKVNLTSGKVEEHSIGDQPWGMASHGDSIWIAASRGLIRYYPSNDTYKQYLPKYQSPNFLYADVDANGDVWLTSRGYAALFKFSPSTGNFTMYRTKYINSPPYHLKVGTDGSIWFTQTYFAWGPLGRLFPGNGTIVEYFTTKSASGIAAISIQKDVLWLTDYADNAVWRFDTTNVTFERYPLPDQGTQPYMITAQGDEAYATGYATSQLIHASYKVDKGKISGKVVDKSGAPITNAKIKITGKESFTLNVDSKGEFTVDALPGAYTIAASAKGYFNASGSLEVKSNKVSTITLTLELDPASLLGWANGIVKDASNESKVIAGAQVVIGDRLAKAGADGKFNVTIPEGSYTIAVSNNTYFSWNGNVTVVRGKENFTNVLLLKIPVEPPVPAPETPWGTIMLVLLAIIVVIVLIFLYMLYQKSKRKKGVVLPEIKSSPQDAQPAPAPITTQPSTGPPPVPQPAQQVERSDVQPPGGGPPGT